MGFLLFILLILFLLVGIPLIRGWLYMQNLKHRVNETFGGRRQERSRREAEEEYTESGDRKIYGSNEGEYAEYEEVTGAIIEGNVSTSETHVIEEQVTDAEFEEI